MSASRWLSSLIGTVLLAGLLWWFGPLWSPLEPVLPRVAGVQALLLLWAVANAGLDAQRRRRTAALSAGLSAVDQERDAVTGSLGRALARMPRRQRATLLNLPWYAIIGPPGAGKTTALLNAGLTFPLADASGAAPVPGLGGTRLCDWWFTDSAVLIDTAGRYTTQDSDATVDRAGWTAFLSLLKRTRPGRPLNGAIVAIGLPDVMAASAAEHRAHAAAIAARLAELDAAFGLRLPVYALFTKADLVAGFTEFFDDLDADGRAQVWGETFAADERGDFTAALRGLAQRVVGRTLPRLAAEQRPDRRPAIAGFAAEMAEVVPTLADFASAALGASRVRGVYLVSGTQEGTPLARLAGRMSRDFGLAPRRVAHGGAGRSFFLGRLLRNVIFGEAELVAVDPVAIARQRWARRTGFVAVAAALIGTAGAALWAAREAAAPLGPVSAALDKYRAEAAPLMEGAVSDGELRGFLPILARTQALPRTMPDASGPLGMGQGPKLAAGARAIERDALAFGLFPRLLWRLEADLRGTSPDPAATYDTLRVYLMLAGAGPLDAGAVRDWLVRDWQRTEPDEDALPAALAAVESLLAETLPRFEPDIALIEAARRSIERVPAAERAFAAIRTSAEAAALPAWSPADSLGLAGASLLTRASGTPMTVRIPGLFTAAGYRGVLLPALPAAARRAAGEGWITGRAADAIAPAALEAGIRSLWGAGFTARWDAMLGDLTMAPIGSLPQAAQALYVVASPESPVRALLRSIGAQLRLPSDADPALTTRYAPLLGLVDGDGAALDRSMRLVADIQQVLAKIAALPVGSALPAGGEDIGAGLASDAVRQPPPVRGWLASIAASVTPLRTGDVRRQLSLLFNAPGGPAQLCAAAMTHAPFTPGGTPLNEEEFTRVFGPAGALDGFVNTRLKPFMEMTGQSWTARPGAPISTADAALFGRAVAIRAAFFPGGGSAAFPVELSPAAPSQVGSLSLGAVTVDTGRSVARPALVTWPPPAPAAADVTLQTEQAGAPVRESGFWALHRLFARARSRPVGKAGTELLSFGTAPDIVSFTLRSPALQPGLLAGFRCPTIP